LPATGTAAHTPQFAVLGTAQYVVWHWPDAKHGEPVASGPAKGAHAAGGFAPNRFAHDSVATAAAHAA
jgi:hypothetical protein